MTVDVDNDFNYFIVVDYISRFDIFEKVVKMLIIKRFVMDFVNLNYVELVDWCCMSSFYEGW